MPLSFPCTFWHSHRLENSTLEAHAIEVIAVCWSNFNFLDAHIALCSNPAESDMLSRRLSRKGTFQLISYMQCDMPIMQNLSDSTNTVFSPPSTKLKVVHLFSDYDLYSSPSFECTRLSYSHLAKQNSYCTHYDSQNITNINYYYSVNQLCRYESTRNMEEWKKKCIAFIENMLKFSSTKFRLQNNTI